MNEEKQCPEENTVIKRYPKKIITSFQLGNLIGLMMSQLYAQQLAFYYQSVIGLDVALYAIAMVFYTIFNMFNDPLLGFLCDRSKRLTSKWGKRFPFIVMGGIPYCFMVIFIFLAPSISQIGQMGVFFWMLFFLCLSDCFFSLYDINRVALFPDKFRDNKDRRFAGTITAVLETLGILMGILIPVLIIEMIGAEVGWSLQAIVIATLAFFIFLLMMPGVHENREMREHRSKIQEKQTPEPFFKGMKAALKNRNLIGYIVFYTCYSAAMGVVMASIPFFVQDILQMSKIGEIILVFYVIAVIAAAPLWYKVSFKIGIKKVALIGALLLACMGLPLMFIPIGPSCLPLVIMILIMGGFVDGAIISMTMPIFSSVIDEAALSTGRRQEGMYNGTFLFFARLAIAYQAIVFWIVQTLSGYKSGSTNPAELWGLRIQIGLFPLLIISVGILTFWKCYKISTDQIETNAKKLKEINL